MPTTRNQKKARKSRGVEMLSDIENLDIMLGENHFNRNERDETLIVIVPEDKRVPSRMSLKITAKIGN